MPYNLVTLFNLVNGLVATTGNYSDLSGTPTIPTNNNQLTNGAGYITSADGGNAATLDGIDSTSFLRSDAADVKTSGDLTFNDNVKASFGTDGDLKIVSNNIHSYYFKLFWSIKH